MNNQMEFPKNIEDFIKNNEFVDKKEVYTNGAELIPTFRVIQMLEHYCPNVLNENKLVN